jgi:GNAT superfamily N-acetyltransferase
MSDRNSEEMPPIGAGKPVADADRWSGSLTTRNGYTFHVRPARPDDAAQLAEFFRHVSEDDIRFRFLIALDKVGHERLVAMTAIDHDRTENFLALDDEGRILASGMLAADPQLERGEVAISIRTDHKRRGISWSLLEHIAAYAEARGIKTLESIEARENRAAIELEQEMGFTAHPLEDDPTLVLVRRTLG